jgi:hypothetical protein
MEEPKKKASPQLCSKTYRLDSKKSETMNDQKHFTSAPCRSYSLKKLTGHPYSIIHKLNASETRDLFQVVDDPPAEVMLLRSPKCCTSDPTQTPRRCQVIADPPAEVLLIRCILNAKPLPGSCRSFRRGAGNGRFADDAESNLNTKPA